MGPKYRQTRLSRLVVFDRSRLLLLLDGCPEATTDEPTRPLHPSVFSTDFLMSTSKPITDRSSVNLNATIGAASNEYTLTKQDLGSQPLVAALERCRSPDFVLKILRTEAQTFDKFHRGGNKLTAWLTRIIHISFRNLWRRCWFSTHPVLL